nr:hypothetical protein [Tanacetum cinerariifolium]
MMAALELVNLRVSYQVDVCTRESLEFCTRHQDAQKDRAAVRAEIEVLRSERLACEQEGIQTHEALARSEAYRRALEARVVVLETHARRLEWQRQAADDFAVQHIMRTQDLEAGARDDTLEDTASRRQIMARTKRGQTPPPTNPNSMTPETVQTMIDQALLRNSSGEDGSHRTEGAVGLTRWIEKMESVLTSAGPDAYTMTWSVLKKKMTDKYCPLGEVKKLEIELWNLKVRDNDIPAYTNRFQELALICTKFVSNETEKVDKYISGLPENIYGNVKSSKPKTLDETIKLANDLMDQKLRTYAERKSDSKRRADDISRNNQQPFKRQNVAKAYNLRSAKKKTYEGNAPKCTKCQRNHPGPCTLKCHKCGNIGHYARDCRSTGNTNATNNRGNNGPNPRGNGCFECGNSRHFKRDCPKLKNKDGGNGNAQGWVYVVGNAERNVNAAGNSDSNVVTDNHYDVELADGKIVGINTIIRGCTLNLLNHSFTIDLMPIELGSFDVIIGIDWLRRHHAVIVCDEKLVRVPFGNETLVFHGAESYIGRESRLTVISCSKVQEYMAKGCHVFLAQISTTKEDEKSKGKQVKDVPIVQDFPKVFHEDLPGLPPVRPIEFQIDLIPGAAPVAQALYRLAPSEMKEFSEQLQELSNKGFIRPSSSPWGAARYFEDGIGRLLRPLQRSANS